MKKTFNKMSIENNNNTYYKKVGRKYVPVQYYDVEGLQEGLWLIYKNKYSKGMINMLYPILTHELQNVGKFCDFYKAHKEKIQEMVAKEYEEKVNANILRKIILYLNFLSDHFIFKVYVI